MTHTHIQRRSMTSAVYICIFCMYKCLTSEYFLFPTHTQQNSFCIYMCLTSEHILFQHINLQMYESCNIMFQHTAERILHTYVSRIRTYSVSTHTHIILHIYKSRIRATLSVHTQHNSFCIYMCPTSEHILFPHTHTLSCI